MPGIQTIGNQYLPDRPANLYLRDRVTGNTTWVSADVVTELGLQTAPVIPGKSYRVEFKNQLSDPVWQELSGQVSVAGNQCYLKDTSLTTTRFYRVVGY